MVSRKTILITIICLVTLLPLTVAAQTEFHFVPCGRSNQQTANNPDAQCQFKHLVIMIIRLINYLISFAAIVAIHRIITGGWDLVSALGNPEKIENGKKTISHAVVGFGIVILAFIFVNLLANGLFGQGGVERKWFTPECVWGIGDRESGCPTGIVSPTP